MKTEKKQKTAPSPNIPQYERSAAILNGKSIISEITVIGHNHMTKK